MAFLDTDLPVIQSGNNNNGGFFGSDGIWAILLFALIFGNNGWGFGGGNSGGGNRGGNCGCGCNNMLYDINQNTNRGFDNLALNSGIDNLQTAVSNGFANAEVSRCNAQANLLQTLNNNQFGLLSTLNANNNALNGTITNGFFDMAMANQKCCCANQLATADLKSTIISENCLDRQTLNEGVRDIIESNNRTSQLILDKLCQQEIDAKNDLIGQLRSQLSMADLRASQTAQTAQILAGQTAEVDALYNRLASCPVGTTPVYGNQPIFTCPRNNNNCGCGCGCNGVSIQ